MRIAETLASLDEHIWRVIEEAVATLLHAPFFNMIHRRTTVKLTSITPVSRNILLLLLLIVVFVETRVRLLHLPFQHCYVRRVKLPISILIYSILLRWEQRWMPAATERFSFLFIRTSHHLITGHGPTRETNFFSFLRSWEMMILITLEVIILIIIVTTITDSFVDANDLFAGGSFSSEKKISFYHVYPSLTSAGWSGGK